MAVQVEGSDMAGRESVSYDYLAPPRTDDAAADAVSSEDAEGETQRCAVPGLPCTCVLASGAGVVGG